MKIDTSKTLEQLENVVVGEPPYGSHLVTECHRLYAVPLKDFTIGKLRILIGQNIGLHFLIPLALDILEKNPWAMGDYYPGDLMENVVSVDKSFWTEHQDEMMRVSEIIDDMQLRIETFTQKIHPKWLDVFTTSLGDKSAVQES